MYIKYKPGADSGLSPVYWYEPGYLTPYPRGVYTVLMKGWCAMGRGKKTGTEKPDTQKESGSRSPHTEKGGDVQWLREAFTVRGMTCSACSTHVEKAVSALEGVTDVTVSLLQNSMSVAYDPALLLREDIQRAVERAGYSALLPDAEKGIQPVQDADTAVCQNLQNESSGMKKRLLASVALLVPLLYISMGHMLALPLPSVLHGESNAVTFALVQFLLTLGILLCNQHYFIRGFQTLLHRRPTMDSLVAIGSSAAVVYGLFALVRIGQGLAAQNFTLVEQYSMDLYFETAGTILTLITLGKFLEARAKGKTGDAITGLLRLAPPTALVERDSEAVELPLQEVHSGDILLVKSGTTVPVDGVVLEGNAAVDESALTGESLPVEKQAGDTVTGGTMNASGFIKLRCTRVGEDSTLAQMARLVREAASGKAPVSRMADRVSAVFVPLVIAIALVTCVVWLLAGQTAEFALSSAIAVLVVSCPCALGLATPTAIMVGTGRGAQMGILFKTAQSLENAHKAQCVVLDKTGTVTAGKPAVTGVYPAQGVSEETLLLYAGAAEQLSEHPLAHAVAAHALQALESCPSGQDLQELPGQGIIVSVDGECVLAGNAKLMEQQGVAVTELISIAQRLAQTGQTVLYFARWGRLLGLVGVADTIRPGSAAAVAELRRVGKQVLLLTGDTKQAAEAIARQAGIDTVIAGVLPQEKAEKIRLLRDAGSQVIMVGDGVNDAPALALADIGIAIGAGTDIAMESADIVLMKSDLRDVPRALALSAATLRNIRQNLFWAFFYNAAGIPLAAGLFYPLLGLKLNPMFAAAAMSLSSVFVVTNALRLRFWKPKEIEIKERTAMEITKIIQIEGMSCAHCKARVEQALNALEGVSALVDLDAKTASVTCAKELPEQLLAQTVTDAGYTVISFE